MLLPLCVAKETLKLSPLPSMTAWGIQFCAPCPVIAEDGTFSVQMGFLQVHTLKHQAWQISWLEMQTPIHVINTGKLLSTRQEYSASKRERHFSPVFKIYH